jgi:hypothetical protein
MIMYVCTYIWMYVVSTKEVCAAQWENNQACCMYVCLIMYECMYYVCTNVCIMYVPMYVLCMYQCMYYVCTNVWLCMYVHMNVCM